ncbi:MAG: hypothetical protein NVSMB45_06150 [Ginsengibacter sp.]
MIKPIIPSNEVERVKALRKYNILDSLPEEDYDHITMLASVICDTPISTITLIDSHRVFLKSHRGLDGNSGDRNTSFCAHAINNPDELMVVPDSRIDPRFADNPNVIGDPHVVFYSGVPLVSEDGYAIGTLCVVDSKPHEITEVQKQSLKSLGRQLVRLLELRLKNQLLDEQKAELEVYAKDMEMFAYVASHDLKEPLRMVKSFNELLERKYSDLLDDTAKKYISFSIDGVVRMNSLIDNLLLYFTAGTLLKEKQVTDVNHAVNEILKSYESQILNNELKFHVSELPVINISKTEIALIFQNLISNAIKYQNQENVPEIHINYKLMDDKFQFAIRDNGIGIKAEHLEEIFSIFKRLHNRSEYGGTGIGLSIVKRIVEQNGRKVWAESEVGKGSTFYFTLSALKK